LRRDDQLAAVRLVLVNVLGPGGLELGVVFEQVIVEAEFVGGYFVAGGQVGVLARLARQIYAASVWGTLDNL